MDSPKPWEDFCKIIPGKDQPESIKVDMPEALPNQDSSASDGGPELEEDGKNGEKLP